MNAVPGVAKAIVNLEKAEAEIEMENHISIPEFQKALPLKYAISEKKVHHSMAMAEEKPEWRQLFPLFLILGYITTASILLNRNPFDVNGFMLDFMGLFYIVFSFFKLLDLKGFPESFRMYDPLANKLPVYAKLYPFYRSHFGVNVPDALSGRNCFSDYHYCAGLGNRRGNQSFIGQKIHSVRLSRDGFKTAYDQSDFYRKQHYDVMAVIMLISMFYTVNKTLK